MPSFTVSARVSAVVHMIGCPKMVGKAWRAAMRGDLTWESKCEHLVRHGTDADITDMYTFKLKATNNGYTLTVSRERHGR